MDTADFARVVTELSPRSALLVEPGSSAAAHSPAQWAAIAGGHEATARCEAAVALWNLDMLELVPRFGTVLAECLDDVRVCLLGGDWVLLYALRKPFQAHEFRIGWDPATFGADQPPQWSALPEALRVFLGTVHAGFTALDGMSFGPTRPRNMETYRALRLNDPVRNWEAGQDIPGDRIMLIAKGMGDTHYCVSPDLPDGTIGWEAGGNVSGPLDFSQTFDKLMSHGFQLERDRPPTPANPVPAQPLRVDMPVARAVVWNRELTEDAARERVRDLVSELLADLGDQLRARALDGVDGETVLPFDDGAGNLYQVDRLEVRYALDPPPPDRAGVYLSVAVRIWQERGWKVTVATEPDGMVAHAATSDWYELTLSHRDDATLHLAVASPGFHRPSR